MNVTCSTRCSLAAALKHTLQVPDRNITMPIRCIRTIAQLLQHSSLANVNSLCNRASLPSAPSFRSSSTLVASYKILVAIRDGRLCLADDKTSMAGSSSVPQSPLGGSPSSRQPNIVDKVLMQNR